MAIEGDLRDMVINKLKRKGYLIAAQGIGEIDLTVRVKENSPTTWTLVVVQD
jgi:hypothetical protein